MIFYNYEGYFGKRKSVEDEKRTPTSPDTGNFDTTKWQWHLMVLKLVNELNMKPDEVYEMNYISALNWLSMFNERDKFLEKNKKKL